MVGDNTTAGCTDLGSAARRPGRSLRSGERLGRVSLMLRPTTVMLRFALRKLRPTPIRAAFHNANRFRRKPERRDNALAEVGIHNETELSPIT